MKEGRKEMKERKESSAVGPPDSSSTAETTLWSSTFPLMTFDTDATRSGGKLYISTKTSSKRTLHASIHQNRVHNCRIGQPMLGQVAHHSISSQLPCRTKTQQNSHLLCKPFHRQIGPLTFKTSGQDATHEMSLSFHDVDPAGASCRKTFTLSDAAFA